MHCLTNPHVRLGAVLLSYTLAALFIATGDYLLAVYYLCSALAIPGMFGEP